MKIGLESLVNCDWDWNDRLICTNSELIYEQMRMLYAPSPTRGPFEPAIQVF